MYITEGPEGDEEGEGEGGGGGEAWEVVGKRQGEEYVAGKGMEWEGLTEGEIERLGLLLGEDVDADAEVDLDLDEREAGGVVVGGVVVEDADAEVDLDEREAAGVVVGGVAVEETPLIQPEEVAPDASEVPTTGPEEPPAVALEEPLETIVAPVDPLDAPPGIFAPPIETIAPATPIDPREDAIIEEEAVEISAAEPKSLPERGIVEEPPDVELPIRTADAKKAGEEKDKERRERSVTEEEYEAPVEVPAVEALKTAGAAEEEVIVEEAEEMPMLGVTDLITERAVLEALNDDDTEKTIPNKRKAADAQIVPQEEEPEPKKLRLD
ncbi:hypothetical protein FPV67DRAFT_1511462 [Lyophyllum atratum]|nr:hypothetical protein FPV67DRAFT_1511462 [Lyophyllum atratum]